MVSVPQQQCYKEVWCIYHQYTNVVYTRVIKYIMQAITYFHKLSINLFKTWHGHKIINMQLVYKV